MFVQPVKIALSKTAEAALVKYLRDRIRGLKTGLHELHQTRVVRWRKAYEAIPAEAVREFPFHNASNIVIPVIAIHSDTLLARLMSAVMKTNPLWSVRLVGGQKAVTEEDGLRGSVEEFMQYVGLEPSELDLYRVYHEWFGETIRFGTSTLKMPWERQVIDRMVPAGDGTGEYETVVKYEGPKPVKITFEDFFIPPSAKTLEDADFKAHRIRLQKHQLEERSFKKIYDKDAVAAILKMGPDRTSQEYVQQQKEQDAGARTTGGYGFAEWDIFECWFMYRIPGGQYVRCIVWFHEKSSTILRAFHDYYPEQPFVTARLFYRDDMFFGYGFCEILEGLQEEISQIHNGRRDNMTVANARVWRVSPDSKLHQGYRIYPSAMLPAEKDEIEAMAHGELSPVAIEEERLALELAEKRSGISGPIQGSGAGTNTKRGVYTAMGTLSLLQEGNTRTDLNISDIRYAHTKVGRMLASLYGHFGVGDRVQAFGEIGQKVQKALEAMERGQLVMPVSSSSASVNREVEKQNDLMLSGVLGRHYQTVTQMLQAAANPALPPNVQSYLGESIKAAEVMMKSVLRHFGYDESDRMIPKAEVTPPQQPGAQPGGTGAPAQGAPGGVPPELMKAIAAAKSGGQPQ